VVESTQALLLLRTRIALQLSSLHILFASIRPRLVNQSGINDVTEPVLPSITGIATAKSELTTRTDHTQARARACTRAHCHAVQKHTYNSKRHIGRALSRQTLTLKQTLAALTWIFDLTRESLDLEHKRQPSTAAQAEVHTAKAAG